MSPAAKLFGPAIVAAGVLLAGFAHAETPQDRRMCDGEDGATVEQRIAGCTAVIKASERRKACRSPGITRCRLSQPGRTQPGDCRLQSGDQDQSEVRAGLSQSRRRLRLQGRPRPRHSGLRPGDQAQAHGAGALQSRQRASGQEPVRPGYRRLQPRNPPQAGFRRRLRQPLLGARRNRRAQTGAGRL